jgi:hypothetical protein
MMTNVTSYDVLVEDIMLYPMGFVLHFWEKIIGFMNLHHKFHGSRLAIIVMQDLLFIGLYKVDMNVIHLFVLFEHKYCVHCLDTNFNAYLYYLNTDVVCIFVLFTPKSCSHDFCV